MRKLFDVGWPMGEQTYFPVFTWGLREGIPFGFAGVGKAC